MTATPWTSSELVRTRQALRALALRLVADADAADDVVQDAYAALAARGEPPATPERWLARVTRNLALRWRRDLVRRQRREVAGVRGEATPDAPTVAVQVELQRDLADAVLALAEPYRATLLQRFWEGKPPSAIAAATDTPVATVKARLQRGLALVRSALDRRYGDRATWRAALVPMLGAGGTLAVGGVGVSAGWKIATAGIVVVGLSVAWVASRPGAVESAGADGAAVMAASSSARGGEAAGTVPSTEPTSTTSTRTLVDALGEHLEVEVVGADGLPAADIGVGLRGLHYERGQGKWWERYRSVGRTDASGRLRVEASRLPEMLVDDGWWGELASPEARVYIDEPGFVDVATEPLTRSALARARVRLELPASGSLRIVSTDALGRPIVHAKSSVQVNEAPDRDATPQRPSRNASWSKNCDGSGSTMFAPVRVGAPLSIVSSWADWVRCPPPTRPGEECVVLLGAVEGSAILTGRLVDAAGRHLAHTPFEVFARARSFGSRSGLTHADGSFAVGIGGPGFLRRVLDELYVSAADGVAYPKVVGPLEARAYDLGDVLLRPAPVIVSGRVLMPESVHPGSPTIEVERLEHVKYLDGTEQDVWQRVERAGLRRDGVAFSFHGEIEGGRLRVKATTSNAPGLLPPAPVEFPLGTTDVLLPFRAGGVLEVSFAGANGQLLGVSLGPALGVVPTFAASTSWVRTRSDSDYSFQSLWPGRYRLLAQVLGDATPTLVVDGIDVAEGQTTTLGPLSLPAPIRELTVRIEDETGKPLRLSALVAHPTRGESATVLLAPEGEVSVPTTAASVDVVATAAGRRAVRLQLDADTTVRLAPATTRSVALEDAIPALPQDVEFALEVHVSGADANLREQSDSLRTACVGLQSRRKLALDPAGRGSFEVAQAGRYRIVPVLLTLKTRFYYRVEIEGAAVELVVGERDLDAAAAIAVTLPEADLRKALARVGELLTR